MTGQGQKQDSDTQKSKSRPPHPTEWHPYMFSSSIPESTMTFASEVHTVMQWAAMPVRLLVFI
jgi:hypothetical protein